MKEKIYILVKTYPNFSMQYEETVCTAGVLENGKWVRIYPVPYRLLQDYERYEKHQWISVDLQRNTRDHRRESYRPISDFKLLKKVGTNDRWAERREILSAVPVYSDMQELINKAQKNSPEKKLSLAMFKPAQILNFSWEKNSSKLDTKKVQQLETRKAQIDLIPSKDNIEHQFKNAEKLPYKFFYHFRDAKKKESRMMIEDWEVGALFWNCLRKYNDELIALRKVKQKFLNGFATIDLHLILGTTYKHHNTALNPFVIVGVYYPPFVLSKPLFLKPMMNIDNKRTKDKAHDVLTLFPTKG